MKIKYLLFTLFTLFSILFFGVSTSQTKFSFSGLGVTSGGYKSIITSPTGANIVVSNTVTYLSPIFYQTAVSTNAFTFTIKRNDNHAFTFHDMTWRNFGVARTLAPGTKILFKRGNLSDVTWTLSAAALNGETSAKTIFNKSSAVTGVTEIIITADLTVDVATSNNIEFKDITLAFTPTVSTTVASSIDFTSVTLAGNATEEGDAVVTEKGIVYSPTATNSNPLINGSGVVKNTNGTGIGVFSESITSLTSDTQYSFKAYAISSVGIGYGNVRTFRTLDDVPPEFNGSESTPTDNATGVSTTATIIVDFDENIAKGTGTITIINIFNFINSEVFDITTATTTSTPVEGALGLLNDKLYINPTNALEQGEDYAIYIASTAINDTSDNSFAGIDDPSIFNFTTLDDTNPIFNSAGSTPIDNATGIVTTANIVVDFDENITKGTGTITIRDATSTVNFEVFDIATATSTNSPAAGALGLLNDKLYINPTNALVESGNVYAIQIAATAIDDTFGNSFAGITDETTFNFTTANPYLGTYSDVTISSAGDNTTATPDTSPHQVVGITAYTNTNFKGEFTVNSLTGVVQITNAYPAGTYTVTV
ncbi:MAG: Ig-like domain-containing protein, partial [Flavobacteriaceae bacterium]|nr:Ig-like domain-containing protein [Flavobacteriaceae bacterium]